MVSEQEFQREYLRVVENDVAASMAPSSLSSIEVPGRRNRGRRALASAMVAASVVAAGAIGVDVLREDKNAPATSTPAAGAAKTTGNFRTPPAGLIGTWELYDAPGLGAAAGQISFGAGGQLEVRIYGCGSMSGTYQVTTEDKLRVDLQTPGPACSASTAPGVAVMTPERIRSFLGDEVPLKVPTFSEQLILGDPALGLGLSSAVQPEDEIAAAPAGTLVPDLLGLSEEAAVERLKSLGVTGMVRGIEGAGNGRTGNVEATIPGAGSTLTDGETVQVWVSTKLTRA